MYHWKGGKKKSFDNGGSISKLRPDALKVIIAIL